PFPEERWADWYRRWVEVPDRRFYRLLLDRTAGKFVGEVSFHWDGELGKYLCDVLIAAAFRGRGYGRQGLELLCGAAGASGVKTLCDNIALDNPSVRLFLRSGFRERYRNETFILVEKEL
ncbi:MAG: GNAT family N-acetyltransferase, partial [Oscillospiraceae bacterium]|nr:GNAT family N-acetyltransferase [Oscillospiraceae bacterium]